MHQIIKASYDHIELMMPFIRQADIEEMWASDHKKPDEALRQSLMCSTDARVGIADGSIVCIFGVAPVNLLEGTAAPWMIATSHIDKYASIFLRNNKDVVNEWIDTYPHLFNYVDARNFKAKKWLKWLGFVLSEAKPYGKEQLPFHYFERRK